MKIDRISYQKIFPTGMMYLNHKIGVEVQVDDRDDIDEAYAFARRTVEGWNSTSNPGMAAAMEYMKPMNMPPYGAPIHYDENNKSIPEVQVNKTPEERKIAVMIKDMQSVTSLEVLKTYEFLAKKFPEIKDAYDLKLKELSK